MKLLTQIFLLLLTVFWMNISWQQEITYSQTVHHGFIENKGQWDNKVLFKSQFQGGNLWIEQHKLMFHLQDYYNLQQVHANPTVEITDTRFREHIVNVNFVNSNKITRIDKGEKSKFYFNYFIGNDKNKWQSDVHAYYDATMKDVYNGIDLKIIEQITNLKYEFHVQPNADASQIKLYLFGQNKLSVNEKGDLIIETELGNIIEKSPYSYQIKNGKILSVSNKYQIKGDTVTFDLGNYDKSLPLIIDPVLVFATYDGSVTDNFGMTATYCSDGSAMAGGTIYGNAYPTPDPNAYDVTSHFTVPNVANAVCTDVFISKYNPTGTQMLWTSFFGGGNNTHGTETVHSLICDQMDNVYFFGATSSNDIPIVNGYQSTHAGGQPLLIRFNGTNFDTQGIDIYVGKFSANGHSLLGSTYLGGSGNDGLNYTVTGAAQGYNFPSSYDSVTINYGDQFRGEIMLDQNNNVLIASSSRSTNFPTVNPIQATNGGGQDGVVFKLNNNLSSLLFSTYFGGSNNDACYSVKVDSSYNVIVAGASSSTNLPTTSGVWQSSYNGGKSDGYVLKMPPSLSSISAMTYIGTSNLDHVFFVEIDRNDNIFLLGSSQGGQFPVINATYSNPNSGQFIMKMNPTLTSVIHSTVFGNGNGGINISPAAFLVDNCGNVYISGWGANLLQSVPLSGMPTTPGAFQTVPQDGFDFYLSVFDRDFSYQIYGTYMGSLSSQEHVDGGTSRFDKNGVVYQSVCGGCGGHSDFPTTPGAWSNQNLSSNCNNIVFKFDFEIMPHAIFTTDVVNGCVPLTVNFNNQSAVGDHYVWDFGNGDLDSTTYSPTKIFNDTGSFQVYLYVRDSICEIVDTALVTIHVSGKLLLDVQDTINMCESKSLQITPTSYGTAYTWHWSSNNQFTDQLNNSSSDSILQITPTQTGYYYVKVSNQYCTEVDSVFIYFIGTDVHLEGVSSICRGQTTTIHVINENPQIPLTYQWSPSSIISGSNSGNSVLVYPDSSCFLYLVATTNSGCVIKDSVWIKVSQFSGVTIDATAIPHQVFAGDTVQLSVVPSGYTYHWVPSTGVENPNAQTTNVIVGKGQMVYQVTVSDGGMCPKSDTVIIYGKNFTCDNPFVFVPNAFSPNGDGDNDILYVRSAVASKVLLRIFDRWGEMVFETKDQHNGWNGTYKGRPCDPDVYDYYLEVTCIDDETKIIKGNITLIR